MSKSPTVAFDWQDWLPYIADSDLSDDQKRELIETLWSIVIAFVDLGFEVGPPADKTCGQSFDLAAALRSNDPDMVKCAGRTADQK